MLHVLIKLELRRTVSETVKHSFQQPPESNECAK